MADKIKIEQLQTLAKSIAENPAMHLMQGAFIEQLYQLTPEDIEGGAKAIRQSTDFMKLIGEVASIEPLKFGDRNSLIAQIGAEAGRRPPGSRTPGSRTPGSRTPAGAREIGGSKASPARGDGPLSRMVNRYRQARDIADTAGAHITRHGPPREAMNKPGDATPAPRGELSPEERARQEALDAEALGTAPRDAQGLEFLRSRGAENRRNELIRTEMARPLRKLMADRAQSIADFRSQPGTTDETGAFTEEAAEMITGRPGPNTLRERFARSRGSQAFRESPGGPLLGRAINTPDGPAASVTDAGRAAGITGGPREFSRRGAVDTQDEKNSLLRSGFAPGEAGFERQTRFRRILDKLNGRGKFVTR